MFVGFGWSSMSGEQSTQGVIVMAILDAVRKIGILASLTAVWIRITENCAAQMTNGVPIWDSPRTMFFFFNESSRRAFFCFVFREEGSDCLLGCSLETKNWQNWLKASGSVTLIGFGLLLESFLTSVSAWKTWLVGPIQCMISSAKLWASAAVD